MSDFYINRHQDVWDSRLDEFDYEAMERELNPDYPFQTEVDIPEE